MFAVVTESRDLGLGRKITVQNYPDFCHIAVGKKVGRRRILKQIRPFGERVIFSKFLQELGFLGYDTQRFCNLLWFKQFCEHCISLKSPNLTVGVLDKNGDFLPFLSRLTAHTAQTVICTENTATAESFCQKILAETGTCPDVVSTASPLSDCDVVFSPLVPVCTRGVLFGKGGISLDQSSLPLPYQYGFLKDCGISPADILCMLSTFPKKLSETPVLTNI